MKKDPGGASPAALTIYRILLAVAALLVCALIAGTILGLRSAEDGAERKGAGDTDEHVSAYFTGIGRIRAASSGAKPATIVVSIAFPFDRNDLAFNEELAAKTKDFRKIAADYFSRLSAAELRSASEAELKEALRGRFNSVLVLGKIEALYFYDYLLID